MILDWSASLSGVLRSLVSTIVVRESSKEAFSSAISGMGQSHCNPLYVRSREGFLYLAFILDACSRIVVCWSMATHLRTQLLVDAWQMAIARRKPAPGLVHHSDRGVHYTSLSFS